MLRNSIPVVLLVGLLAFMESAVECEAAPIAQNDTKPSDESALMDIWNYQIERKVKAMNKYKLQDLAVWEEVETAQSPPATRRYYATPPATLIPSSAACRYIAITNAYEVSYDIQLWEKDLPSAVVAGLKELGLDIREDQIHPLPFYQARIIWNNAEEQLTDLKLTTSWTNNLQQQQVYTFRVAASNNQSCNLLANTIRTSPQDFAGSIQLQFTVSAAKIDSKVVNVKSEHVTSSQLVASLKNLPGADGPTRYLKSDDYNRMLWQISNQVLVSEVTTGDYVDADDEMSLKDVIAQMFQTQKENTAQFDDKMWNSTFWDPLDERPDLITKELNHVIFINQTDHRAYLTQAAGSTTSANLSILKIFGIGGSHSSSSSMTTDDLSHLLEQYDIQSEIDGTKFVPKKLDLQRLNVNDLIRQDQFASKRLRVKEVDIGGVLQVGVGNSSAVPAEDENQRLRQQVLELQTVAVQTRSDLRSLDERVNSNITALQSSINELLAIDNKLRDDIRMLQNQTESMHAYICETQNFNFRPPKEGTLECSVDIAILGDSLGLVKCPEGKFMQSYKVTWACNNVFPLSVTCC